MSNPNVRRCLVPVIRELPADIDTPISVYLKLRDLGPSFLLESVEGGEHLARYSFVGVHPRGILRSWRNRAVLELAGSWREFSLDGRDVLDILRDEMPEYAEPPSADLPRLTGGAIGYMSYDLVRSFERLPDDNPDPLALPEAVFLLTDQLVIFDHAKQRLLVVAHALPDSLESAQEASATLDEMVARLRRPMPPQLAASAKPGTAPEPFISNFTREGFENAVRKAKDYIAAGDIFQVVPSRRISRRTTAQPFDIYRALRRINPSPYMVYMELPDGLRIIASSPEVLVRVDHGIAETRPLAGTRPRGATPQEDLLLERELLADPKERAEHVMLVDLGRNDLGRVCRYGTVRVPELMKVERYSHVMHIVSSVRGELAPGKDAFDALRACFPAGTVSGAPKVRAMQIIDELEPERRGPYAGAIGYFGYTGNMDTCITIRTIVMRGDQVYLQAGGGIVADSDPATEYQETENKLKAAAQALLQAERGSYDQGGGL
ncbi:MAG: anthranilate synthase component I [Anaerolineae bacterium]